MKWLLIITDILLVSIVCIAARYHYDFKEPEPDKALNRTPELVKNVEATTAAIETKQVKIEEIADNNPFHPQRGRKAGEAPPLPTKSQPAPKRNQPKFELAGICELGDTIGAIIIQKGAVRRTLRTAVRGHRSTSRPRSAAPSPQKNQRRFFKLNDEVADGYKLVAVTQTSATLQSPSDKIELKIEHARFEKETKSTPRVRPTPKLPVKRSPSNRRNTRKRPFTGNSNIRRKPLNRRTISSRGNNK